MAPRHPESSASGVRSDQTLNTSPNQTASKGPAIVLPHSKWGAGFSTGGKVSIHFDRQPAYLEMNALDMISGNR